MPAQPTDREASKQAAGAAAFERAIRSGYCKNVARAIRNAARDEWRDGESPEETARRVVATPDASATDRRRP